MIYVNTNGDLTANDTVQLRNIKLFDITQMLGSTIANYLQTLGDSGIAKLKSCGFITDGYVAYNSGQLKSVEGLSAHNMVGFNQWDEEWEVATGAGIRSKNYIPINPNYDYYIKVPYNTASYGVHWRFYDANKTEIPDTYKRRYGSTLPVSVIPSTAHYVKFTTADGVTTYNHDICFNLSNGVKNGTYEPYIKHSYPLDSTLTLRGIPKKDDNGNLYYDGDIYKADGTVQRRYGIVDLGTLTYSSEVSTLADTTPVKIFYAPISDAKGSFTPNGTTQICSKYIAQLSAVSGSWVDKSVRFGGMSKNINICDTSFANYTNDQVKEALSGTYLVYELAAPTTESATPYQELQIVDADGTEEYVTTGIVPVGHNTKYPENLREKIEGLPWNFATLIAPTEKTTTASRNYTTGRLLIMNNVLYKVTSNIANGGTITVGSNVTATTLDEIIASL